MFVSLCLLCFTVRDRERVVGVPVRAFVFFVVGLFFLTSPKIKLSDDLCRFGFFLPGRTK